MTTLEALLRAIVADPLAEPRYLVLADYLEEHDDPRRATMLRLHRMLLATCCEPERYPERAEWQARVVAMLAEGVRPCVPQRTVVLGEGIKMDFNFVPPGTFLMGSPDGEEGRRADEVLHRVTLTRGFWMALTPVTQAQWRAVMGSNPSKFKGDERPVEMVSWDDCVAFCGRIDGGLRLPTEAEWEYACRAGTTTPFHLGKAISPNQANFGYYSSDPSTRRDGPTPAGTFPPNAWGLYDMHGNLMEWCSDWYGAYQAREAKDPEGPGEGFSRVLRGGFWGDDPDDCRSADRLGGDPAELGVFGGFRVVLCPDE